MTTLTPPSPSGDVRPQVTAAVVQAALHAGLQPIFLEVHDDSAAHAGHAGARDGSHFRVSVVSLRFAGLGRVARHRLVYHALGLLMHQGIHALAIDARAPGEV